MTKILITGANGQLGTELRNLLDERGAAYDAFDSKDMDITDKQAVDAKFDALKPAVVYHCARQLSGSGPSWFTSVPTMCLTVPTQASIRLMTRRTRRTSMVRLNWRWGRQGEDG